METLLCHSKLAITCFYDSKKIAPTTLYTRNHLRLLCVISFAIGFCSVSSRAAQDSPELTLARSIDEESHKLKDLPEDALSGAVKDLAHRIRQQPKAYALTLAQNLAIDAPEASGREAMQEVATTLAGALQNLPPEHNQDEYLTLAELARYDHLKVSINDPRYTAAMSKLEANDLHRNQSDFTLEDVNGNTHNLKSLRGKVVLVNFWATWCPPCRKEIPDLKELHRRFERRGLIVLSISDEDSATVKKFLAEQNIVYPVLLDPEHRVKDLFLVRGIPYTFIFDREGRLAAQAVNRPTMQGFLEMLERAGMK